MTVRRWISRSPLAWHPVHRCRLLIALSIPFAAVYAWRAHHLFVRPGVEPYFSGPALLWTRNGLALVAVFWAIFLALGPAARKRPALWNPYIVLGTLSWWAAIVGFAYALGPLTSPAWSAVAIGGVSTLMLMPRSVAFMGIAVGLGSLIAIHAAVAVGIIPYGPLQTYIPLANGRLATLFLVGNGIGALVSTLVLLTVTAYIFDRWRETQHELEHLNAGLERTVEERTDALLRAEAQLRQAEKMEAIGRLAGGIAHDFNNVLGVVMGYAELIAAGSRRVVEDAREIYAAAERASRLVSQLLAVGSRQIMQPRSLQANDVVKETAELLRPLFSEDITLALRLDAGLGIVDADPIQLQQVVLNLAANARDVMPTGGTLTIETANLDVLVPTVVGAITVPPGSYVTLSVSDTGYGIEPDLQSHVFEPFFTTKEPGKGTGLGLSSVYGIVSQSGGLLTLESRPGEGTSFCIFLPRITTPPGPAFGRPPIPAGPARPGVVLLAEDDAALRRLLRRTLAAQGHAVLDANDGVHALELATRHDGPIDVLLTDVVMPRIGGRELADSLARSHPETSVVFMTGYTDDAVLLRGISAREVRLLRKPFSMEALSAVLVRLLGRHDDIPIAVGSSR
jgi:signal transduction histidine kinase/ActR/RegA family two-component response regulator